MRVARRRPRAIARAAGVLLLLAGAAWGGGAARAQGITGAGADGPLEIQADRGIEWRRDERVYIARGNATASRGGVTVHADRLLAHYRETGGGADGADGRDTLSAATGGETQIHRIEAIGGVRIVDPRARAQGDKAVYDLDQKVVVLTGADLRFETDRETITATQSLEYWQARDLAVARGDAVALRGDRRISADVLAARFTAQEAGADGSSGEGADGGGTAERRIERIEAFGGVEVSTPKEYARGDRGVYDAASEIATLTGNVRLTRGENQLNGGWGQVNLRTGVSRLLGAPPDSGGGQRVRALLEPDSAADVKISPTGAAEAEAESKADASPGAADGSGDEGSQQR